MKPEIQFLIDASCPYNNELSGLLEDAIEQCRASGFYYFAQRLLEEKVPSDRGNVDLVLRWIKEQARSNNQDFHPYDFALFAFSLVLHDLKIDNTRMLELVVALSKVYRAWWTHQLYVWLVSKN